MTVTRREFLQYTLATGALAAGERSVGTAYAATPDAISQVDQLTVWVLTDNYFDSLRPDAKGVKRARALPGKSIHAEHGVAFFVEAIADGKPHHCMYDFGLDAGGVTKNISLLGIDLGKVDAFALSHGHYDHYEGAIGILQHAQGRVRRGTPFYAGTEALARRYTVRPGSAQLVDLGQLSRADLEATGVRYVETNAPTEIIRGGYLTGPIERRTPYEKVPPNFQVQRGDKTEHDTFPGEQGLFFHVRGKGLVVLTGCSHSGAINTVLQAQKVARTEKLHAVLGGFHLANARPDLVQSTVGDMKAMKPELIVPAHCTGFEAINAFAREMPNEFVLNTAGTQYTFGGSASA